MVNKIINKEMKVRDLLLVPVRNSSFPLELNNIALFVLDFTMMVNIFSSFSEKISATEIRGIVILMNVELKFGSR